MLRTLLPASLLSLVMISAAEKPAFVAGPETRSLFCNGCLKIVGGIEGRVEKDEPSIEKFAETICDDVLDHVGDLAQTCKDWVEKDFDKIMDKLENDWSAAAICEDYHLC